MDLSFLTTRDLGFITLKDWLQVILMPLILVIIAAGLPKRLEAQKAKRMQKTFVQMISREMEEMAPYAPEKQSGVTVWSDYLNKRFVHEEIFRDVSANRDFILSLRSDLVYHESQMWSAFDKASGRARALREAGKPFSAEDQAQIGKRGVDWCRYLGRVVDDLAKMKSGHVQKELVEAWITCVKECHPQESAGAVGKGAIKA